MRCFWGLISVLVFAPALIFTFVPAISAQEPPELYQLCPMVVDPQPKLLKVDMTISQVF
jgi:hypothetical protein